MVKSQQSPNAGSADRRVEQVSDAQLGRYAELIYAHRHSRFAAKEAAALEPPPPPAALDRHHDFEEYYEHLKKLPPRDPEWDAFLQEITTHETYLFRDETHWKWFRNEYLPGLAASNPSNGRRGSLRIWSAACSSGDEAYTAACCVAAHPDLSRWQVHILGTDIGLGALEQAKAGVFGQRAMRLVPADYRCRFFKKARDVEAWTALPVLTDMLTFRQHNLMEPLHERPFDLVFLKNVLIYFNQQSKTTVLHNVRAAMRPGGLIVTGMAEGVADLSAISNGCKPWLFRKPDLSGARS